MTDKVAFNVSLSQYDFASSSAFHILFMSFSHEILFSSPMTFPLPFTSFIGIHLKLFLSFEVLVSITLFILAFNSFATQSLKESFQDGSCGSLPTPFLTLKMT